MKDYPRPPFPKQTQIPPGRLAGMDPIPDHGEETWRGSGRLEGKVALITGGDSGIGRAVAIAFAREGADVALAYLNEDADAASTAQLVEEAGQRCQTIAGDIADPRHCQTLADTVREKLGAVDILVNNAGHQAQFQELEDIPEEEWRRTFDVNVHAMFCLCKAVAPHMPRGGVIINTTSINADRPNPSLLAYATTKGAILNFTVGLAQLLAKRGIRVNAVAPGPVWTPFIPATMSAEDVQTFGQNYPMGRPAQPAELAAAYVMLAEPRASYISGATIAVTGGMPMI